MAYKEPAGIVVQQVYSTESSVVTATGAIPFDDTIPQNSEGTELLTLAVTPSSASNILHITFSGWGTPSAAGNGGLALFQDSTADAILSVGSSFPYQTPIGLFMEHIMLAGTASATTFKVRVGISSGNFNLNGSAGSTRLYGGSSEAKMIITEYRG